MKEATLELNFTAAPKAAISPEKLPKKPIELVIIPKEVVKQKSLDYFKGDSLAAEVWMNKYALRDTKGNFLEASPTDMHKRIAAELVRIEEKYTEPLSEAQIFEVLDHFKYIVPQGGPMSGIGNPFQTTSLSNCFVIGTPNSDSYGAIMRTDEEQVQLMKRRGGVGHDLSHLRPAGSNVNNSALTSTGVVSFMERYSNSTREVAQGGRRGALMLSLSVKHPDVSHFIDAKTDTSKITGANVSVKIDDDFMQAVDKDQMYTQQYPISGDHPKIVNQIKARDVWNQLVEASWRSAEPGILFWDTIIKESIPDCYSDYGFATQSTNPCGEIPLCPYDSCRLLALNLYSYVENPFTKEAVFNEKLFRKHVKMAVRIMDDIVDLEIEKIDGILDKIKADPEPFSIKRTETELWQKIRSKCTEGRRMGVGITGEADMLAALNLQFGSDESISFSENVHKNLALAAYRSSVDLAKTRNAFPLFDAKRETENPFILRLKAEDANLYEDMVKYGRRNIALLTIAPTGSTSLMTQTSSGIEPVFRISYTRRRKAQPGETAVFIDDTGDQWVESKVFHHAFKDYLLQIGLEESKIELLSNEEVTEYIANSPYRNSTAEDIDWVQKVKMQGVIQKWVDHSISVTVNLPEETPKELVEEVFYTAWKSGCKGITIYREGSRSGVLISDNKKQNEEQSPELLETNPPKRPKRIQAKILRFQNNQEKWVAVVGLVNEKPYEIFTGRAEDSIAILSTVDEGWVIKKKLEDGGTRYDFQYKDKAGYKITIEGLSRCFDEEYWNYAKLISGVLRHGMPLKYAVHLVSNLNLEGEHLNTWKNGVSRTLSKFIEDGTKPIENKCPECDTDALQYQEGCLSCGSCGYTKCG